LNSPNLGWVVFRPTRVTTSAGHGFGGGTCPLCPLLDPPLPRGHHLECCRK